MAIRINEITDENIWEEFVLSCPINSFFQSWAWGEVQKATGNKIWRLGIFDKFSRHAEFNSASESKRILNQVQDDKLSEHLVGICQITKVQARRGSCLHLRHGPILKEWEKEYFSALLRFLKELGLKEKAWFLRMSPLIENSPDHENFFRKFGFKPVIIPRLDASLAWVLDITKSEEELLSQMRKTTRYLIHKAEKMGVVVYEGNKESDLQAFFRIYQETAGRQHFIPHSGIQEEFSILGKAGQVKLFLAKHQGKVMAGALIVFYGRQAVYHHSGASLGSRIPVMDALLWQAILEAKKRGKALFNFWGIGPLGKSSDPWWGLTLFKTGFGGEAKEFLPAHDLPLSPFYGLTRLIEIFWKMKRGY